MTKAVADLVQAVVALRPYIMHICEFSASGSSPDSDVCTCNVVARINAVSCAVQAVKREPPSASSSGEQDLGDLVEALMAQPDRELIGLQTRKSWTRREIGQTIARLRAAESERDALLSRVPTPDEIAILKYAPTLRALVARNTQEKT